ncbi:E3 ubiquitin ligase family protein [Halorarius halobius]|uniref:E3 ubiquitin ligase family protein n=1 Tax=Halorarius halobius TaxID=2962671 RepID=UPI0020CFBBF9|nr:E3 ubiquitin ligase family protein [Halorarius halobius]
MALGYDVVLFGAMMSIALLMLLGGLATPSARDYLNRKPGLSRGYVALVLVSVVALPLVLGAVGTFPGSRGGVRSVGFAMLLVAGGLLAVAYGAGTARRWAAFRLRGDTPTGDVEAGPVSVTGLVECDEPPASPLFGTRAVAWEWTVEAKNRHGTNNEGRRAWSQARSGRDGVEFRVDDGSGPVAVDPTDASLDVAGETVEERDPGNPPGRAADVADLDIGGERFRFRESALTPGTEVTVLGEAAGDPPTVRGGDDPLVVSEGTRSGTLDRYALRAALAGGGGAVLLWVGLGWFAGLFGVPLPV